MFCVYHFLKATFLELEVLKLFASVKFKSVGKVQTLRNNIQANESPNPPLTKKE